jgi:hypothetical protein
VTARRRPMKTPAPRVYGNGVVAERPDLGAVETLHAAAPLVSLGRNGDGYWTLTLDADYRFRLPDGRELRFVGRLRLRGRQSGRGPGRPRS